MPRTVDLAEVRRLVARRRSMRRSESRKPPRQLPRPDQPRGIELAYTSDLRRVVDLLHRETLAALAAEGLHLDGRMDAVEMFPGISPGAIMHVVARLRLVLRGLFSGRSVVNMLSGISSRITTFTREQFQRQIKGAMGIKLAEDPDLSTQMEGFRDQNVRLINSLGRQHVAKVRSILTEYGSGERVETVRDAIMRATGASRSRATLIARTEVLKLASQVSETRMKAAGVKRARWRGVRDERERGRPDGLWPCDKHHTENHWALEGKVYDLDGPGLLVDKAKGIWAKPGTRPNCRCTAEPVIPGIDD